MRVPPAPIRQPLLTATALFLASTCFGQLRIATWNTEDGPTSASNSSFITVLDAMGAETVNGIAKPLDMLILQEQGLSSGANLAAMLNTLYGVSTYDWSLDPATDSNGDEFDDKLGYVWNTATVESLGFAAITTGGPRPAYRGQWRPVGYNNPEAEFYTYSSHFKAGSTSSDEITRAIEAGRLRQNGDSLGANTNIIYAGDYNVQSAFEDAYLNLTNSSVNPGVGLAIDPKDNLFNTINHTQNPQSDMDDRFDFQLISEDVDDGEGFALINGDAYRAFGNDGSHNFNGAITTGTGAAPNVLAALASAADHLPVLVDYQVPSVVGATDPVAPVSVDLDSFTTADFTVFNDADVVAALGADELNYEISVSGDVLAVFGVSTGVDEPLGGGNAHQVVLDSFSPGAKSGQVIVTATSEGANLDPITFDLAWTVVGGTLTGDADGDGDVDGDDLIAVQSNFASTTPPPGDADGDGDVDGDDLIAVQANFGATSAIAVPEPSAWGLFTACLLLRRRRRWIA